MSQLSLFRLYALRGTYLFMAIGLGFTIWPLIINHPLEMRLMSGVAFCLLGAIGLVAILGIRYPVQMLPLLIFELAWKVIWLLAVALPLWRAGMIDPDTRQTVMECLLGIVLMPAVIPWPFVFDRYFKQAGDRWR